MKRWALMMVLGLGAVACSRQPTPGPSPVDWAGSVQATFAGGQTLESPSGVWVGVEGMTFRDGGILGVEVRGDLPPSLAVYDPFLASDVVILRFRGEDLAEAPAGIEGLMYGVALSLPLRRGISAEWGNVVVVANGVPTAMPYAVALRAGEKARVRIPVGVLAGLSRPGVNEFVVFFAEGREMTPSPEEILAALPEEAREVARLNLVGDKRGYPFRLEVRGNEVKLGNGTPYSSGVVAGKKYGYFDPVAVFFSNGLNIFSFWSPVPCSPAPNNPLLPNCNSRDEALTAVYQKLASRIGADMAKKLVGYYRFHHSGHEGFDAPAGRLWDLFNRSYVDAPSLGEGKRKVVLTGFSMGGLVSRSAAVRHPDWVLGIGTINTPHLGSIIADLVTYRDREGDLVDYIARYVKDRLRLGVLEYARFWLQLRDPRRTYIPIAGASEVFEGGSSGIAGLPVLAPAGAVTPLRYVPRPGDAFVRVCVSSRGAVVSVPDPVQSSDPIAGLMGSERGLASRNIRLHAYMTNRLPGKPPMSQVQDFFQWILGNYMGALDFSGPCTGLYPSSPTAYETDGVVARKSGLFDHPASGYYRKTTQASSLNRFHLQATNLNDIQDWANTLAGWVEDFLKNQWMRDYIRQYELAWEYLLSTGGIDLELYGMFRDNTLTLDYLRQDPARRWQEFFVYGGISAENRGMVGIGLSRNAGPEGFALRRGRQTAPKVYLVAAIKNPPYIALDLKVKFHIFEKPNPTSLSGVKDTLIETTRRLTRLSRDLYWIIGELNQDGTLARKIDRWVGVRELDDTTRNGNVTCYWKVKVLDYTDSSGYPIKDNYPILQPGLGTPVRQVRCETTAVYVVPEEVALR